MESANVRTDDELEEEGPKLSKHKNVHPDHYKTGGSGHQGDDIVHDEHREELSQEKAERERSQKGRRRRDGSTAKDRSRRNRS